MMKKILYSFALLLFSLSTYAQDLTLLHGETEIQNGGTIEVSATPDKFDVETLLTLKNNTDTEKSCILIKDVTESTEGQDFYFCVGVSCYPPTVDQSESFALAADAESEFSVHMSPNNTQGLAVVKYTIATEGTNFEFTVRYDIADGINDVFDSHLVSDIYPNPAKSTVNINYDLDPTYNNVKLSIYNLLGSKVKEFQINSSSNRATFNVENLNSGIYFYSIINNDKTISTKKLVIRK
ncbi:MAG: T9SS type A sorting domain-containing protein [Hyphomicrobiales bacterium]